MEEVSAIDKIRAHVQENRDKGRATFTIAGIAALLQERDQFKEWALTWHMTVETLCTLMQIPSTGNPTETLEAARSKLTAMIEDLLDMHARKDEAYRERNKVVRLVASLFPSGIKKTDIPGWDPEWHWCVYVDLPTGQVSWHIHESEIDQFKDLPAYYGEWDGHSTDLKYERVRAAADKLKPTPLSARARNALCELLGIPKKERATADLDPRAVAKLQNELSPARGIGTKTLQEIRSWLADRNLLEASDR